VPTYSVVLLINVGLTYWKHNLLVGGMAITWLLVVCNALLVSVRKRRVIQRPNYSESDENFSRVSRTFIIYFYFRQLFIYSLLEFCHAFVIMTMIDDDHYHHDYRVDRFVMWLVTQNFRHLLWSWLVSVYVRYNTFWQLLPVLYMYFRLSCI